MPDSSVLKQADGQLAYTYSSDLTKRKIMQSLGTFPKCCFTFRDVLVRWGCGAFWAEWRIWQTIRQTAKEGRKEAMCSLGFTAFLPTPEREMGTDRDRRLMYRAREERRDHLSLPSEGFLQAQPKTAQIVSDLPSTWRMLSHVHAQPLNKLYLTTSF